MKKVLVPLVILVFLGSLIGLYFHGKGGDEKEKEAPITAHSKVLPREGRTPVLELPKENAEAAGIEAVELPLGDSQKEFLFPSSSIIRDQDRTWIYLKLSDTQYSKLEVEPVTTSEQGAWRVVEPLPNPGKAMVVTVGAQLLLSEELKSQIQVGEGGGE